MSYTDGFKQHGVNVTKETPSQVEGVCPGCGRRKFFFHPEKGLWDCKVCIVSGNFEEFLAWRMLDYEAMFKGNPNNILANDRHIKAQTFREWGVGYNPATKEFMIPQRGNAAGTIKNIQRYKLGNAPYETSNAKKQLIVPLKPRNTKTVLLCEGFWDAAATWETAKDYDVVASPGAGTFPSQLADYLQGKDVWLLFDNDDAGRKGAKRTGEILSGIAASVAYLHWPKDGRYQKDGFDMRDLCILYHKNPKQVLDVVKDNLSPLPPTQDRGDSKSPAKKSTGKGLSPEEVRKRFQKWLYLPDTTILDIMFGTAFANRICIDPLWLFVVGPPGGGKTEPLVSLDNAPHITTETTLTPASLISGTPGPDPSLIPKWNGKVVVIKDFTTILSMNPQYREEILGILRDAYDGKTQKAFGGPGGIRRCYESRFGIIAGVTPAIDKFSDNAVLGERFVRYRLKTVGQVDVGKEQIQRTLENLTKETTMRAELKDTATACLDREVTTPILTKEGRERILNLAQFSAVLRGQVEENKYRETVLYKPTSEVGTRLSKQFATLALGIACFRMEKVVSPQVLDIVGEVSRDTAPDLREMLVHQLYLSREIGGLSVSEIERRTKLPGGTVRKLLQHMQMLGIVAKGKGHAPLWTCSAPLVKLIERTGLYQGEKVLHKRLKAHGKA